MYQSVHVHCTQTVIVRERIVVCACVWVDGWVVRWVGGPVRGVHLRGVIRVRMAVVESD